MSFVIKDESVLDRCNKIWNRIKKILNTKFHSMLFMMKNTQNPK